MLGNSSILAAVAYVRPRRARPASERNFNAPGAAPESPTQALAGAGVIQIQAAGQRGRLLPGYSVNRPARLRSALGSCWTTMQARLLACRWAGAAAAPRLPAWPTSRVRPARTETTRLASSVIRRPPWSTVWREPDGPSARARKAGTERSQPRAAVDADRIARRRMT